MYLKFNALAISISSAIFAVATPALLPEACFGGRVWLYYLVITTIALTLSAIFTPILSRITAPLYSRIKSLLSSREDRGIDYEWLDAEMGATSDKEIEILQNAIDFSELRVRECMVQRIDIEAVDIQESSVEQLRGLFIESQYSRIMVYDNTIDNIIGYVNVKALFHKPTHIKSILREVMVVTESMLAERLLEAFIRENRSIAVVVDEFGGTAGMVTLEDILEEIFGDIEDEYDTIETIERALGNGEYLFSARLEVEYLNEHYNLDIPESEEYETLAGYLIYHNEDIPKQGEELEYGSIRYRVIKISGSKIDLIKIRPTIDSN